MFGALMFACYVVYVSAGGATAAAQSSPSDAVAGLEPL
jgi:hypothetical protein